MKTTLIALGMVGALFIYGYMVSSTGHDHSSHGKQEVIEHNYDNAGHVETEHNH